MPRTTADLDLTVEAGEHSIAELIQALEAGGFVPKFVDDDFIAATRVIPFAHGASRYPVDVVLAGRGIEQRFLDEAVVRKIGRTAIPVISLENLIVTKVLAGRPRDLEDVRELIADRAEVDHTKIIETLELLEEALGQSDLQPLYASLRAR